MTFRETSLWQAGFGGQYASQAQAADLRVAYHDLSKLASLLVTEISADLRQFTVHDISHLEALWGVGSEIVGPNYEITPTEAFVLGGAILLHDAGMSVVAYPGGIPEISKSSTWPLVLRRTAVNPQAPTELEIELVVAEFIRLEHANRANELPRIEWLSPDNVRRTLIENGDIKQKFGQLIGEVAASHWWSHDKLAANLNRIVPSPPPYPTTWSIDLLKVASILRVADIAQIDERRAPGFLWALRGSLLSKESAKHWLFQNRLTQPARRGDAIHYSSTNDFNRSEAEAWWLAHDTLRIVDDELRRTDVLLADLRGENSRFAARRVANSEMPTTLTRSIRVTGWMPVDTSVKVSDVPKLVRSLGGEALYGQNQLVPVRELIQNAVDAMKLRSVVQPDRMKTAKVVVTLGEENGKAFLQVQDEGVGMAADIIQTVLLDFGGSGWTKDPMFFDYPTKSLEKVDVIGKFGIGFFSVFMIGNQIDLYTRRFDRSFSDTLLLRFGGGVGQRPILSPAPQEDWLMEGGTRIRVWLNESRSLLGTNGFDLDEAPNGVMGVCGRLFPALEFPLLVRTKSGDDLVDGSRWREEDSVSLLKRVTGVSKLDQRRMKLSANLRPIVSSDGAILGRMCVGPRNSRRIQRAGMGNTGAVTVRGVTVTNTTGLFGIIEGRVMRASRDVAFPNVEKSILTEWLAEQAALAADLNLSDEDEIEVAALIRSLQGDTGPLKVCYTSEGSLSVGELFEFVKERDAVRVINDIYLPRRENKLTEMHADLIAVEGSIPGVFQFPHDYDRLSVWPEEEVSLSELSLESLVMDTIGKAWNLDLALLREFHSETVKGVYGKYDLPLVIGSRGDQPVVEFGLSVSKDLDWDKLDDIASASEQARKTSGHYDEYFGTE